MGGIVPWPAATHGGAPLPAGDEPAPTGGGHHTRTDVDSFDRVETGSVMNPASFTSAAAA